MTDSPKDMKVNPAALPPWLLPLNLLFCGSVLTVSILNGLGPEHWWPIAFNLYLPQALWFIPGAGVLLVTLVRARSMAWISLATLCWVAGPQMGFVWRPPAPGIGRANNVTMRVMTYNVKWGVENPVAVIDDIKRYDPDLIVMQDSAGVQMTPVGHELDGWNVETSGQYIVACKLPLSKLEDIDISFPGSNHHAVRFRVLAGGSEVACYTAHLLSPREGLGAIHHHHLKPFLANVAARVYEGERLQSIYVQDQKDSPAPAVIMGDMNSPMQSVVCRGFARAGLRDAFTEAGSGYGYTYGAKTAVGFPYVRIDHVFVNDQFKVTRCWVGNDVGSDHCPVIADLVQAWK